MNCDDFDGYFLWLCSLVNADMDRYSELLFCLHDIDFSWCIDQDSGRAEEGLNLRNEYYTLSNYTADWVMLMDKPCSVLEALIPIAKRMSDMLEGDNSGDTTRVWFWKFLENLKLKKFNNVFVQHDENSDYDIKIAVINWLNREFEFDGTGSIFPLKHPKYDERNRTIVYQMYDYFFDCGFFVN